jgi:hypothetical protein
MSDEYEKRVAKQRRREIEEFESPQAKYQTHLDWWWQNKIDQQAIERARALRGEDPERGQYDPMRCFEEEMADIEEQAGKAYWRGRR